MKFSQKNFENWRFWKMHFFWVGHFEFFFLKKIFFFCFIPMKISPKLCIRIDGTQFLWLWWFTAKKHSPQTYQPAVYDVVETKDGNTPKTIKLSRFLCPFGAVHCARNKGTRNSHSWLIMRRWTFLPWAQTWIHGAILYGRSVSSSTVLIKKYLRDYNP